jgi:cell division protein FtsB
MDLRIKRPEIRIMPQAQRVRSALVERAPQAEAFGRRVVNQIGSSGQPIAREISEKLRPALAWLYGARRRLATIAVGVVTVWLFVHVMFGANGMVVYRQKRAEYQNLSHEIDQLQKENDRYSSQIKSLQTDPETIEKEAREQLHYTRPGEVVYVSPAPPPIQIPSTNAAQK